MGINAGSLGNTCKLIYQNEGAKGFTKGVQMTVINNTKLLIQFPLFYHLQESRDYSTQSSAFLAKMVANTVLYPTDIIRSRLRSSNIPITFWDCVKELRNECRSKNNMIKTCYKGFTWYNLVSIPNFIILMKIKEYAE